MPHCIRNTQVYQSSEESSSLSKRWQAPVRTKHGGEDSVCSGALQGLGQGEVVRLEGLLGAVQSPLIPAGLCDKEVEQLQDSLQPILSCTSHRGCPSDHDNFILNNMCDQSSNLTGLEDCQ